jgi:hypothetical protein
MKTYLHHLQLLQTLLHEFLYPSGVRLVLMLMKCISRPPPRIHSEIIIRKLIRLPEQGPIQTPHTERRTIGRGGQRRRDHFLQEAEIWGRDLVRLRATRGEGLRRHVG